MIDLPAFQRVSGETTGFCRDDYRRRLPTDQRAGSGRKPVTEELPDATIEGQPFRKST